MKFQSPFAVFLASVLSACVTVNIYFPAAAVERAADQIVEETWGGAKGSQPVPSPESRSRSIWKSFAAWSLTGEAFAQQADINVSNPAIRGLKAAIKNRSESIKPYMDKGTIGIAHDGLLVIRDQKDLSLRERAEVRQLVEAENRDREALYREIAKANNFDPETVPKIKQIFAESWIEKAQTGWWVERSRGNWTTR